MAPSSLPEGVFEAVFGGEPDAQAIADTTYPNTHMLRPTTCFVPDIAALRSVASRVVVRMRIALCREFSAAHA